MLQDNANVRSRAVQEARKLLIFQLLGDKCSRCGFNDFRALQIDHINGGGVKELRKHGCKRHYYKLVLLSIKANENKYQLLCANCNWIKRAENREAENRFKVLPGLHTMDIKRARLLAHIESVLKRHTPPVAE